MRRILTVIGVWLLCGPYLFGQYANDWIDYDPDRYYLELRITKDGLYRVSSSTWESALSEIGLDLTDVDPRSIQVFGRGEEQYIHVEGETDGSFDSGDYIEFFGQCNDGWADESLYPSSDEHTNPHYSLFNDTASYYITWDPNDSASSFRYETIGLTTPSGQSLSYVWSTARRFYNNVYQKGEDLRGGVPPGFYVGGKGWMSGNFGYNNGNTPSLQPVALNTPHAYTLSGAPQATLEVALSGIN